MPTPKWVGALELLGSVLYLGTIARESATCWEDGNNISLLPVALLVVAGFAVRNGATQAARIGASILWFVVPGVIIILLAGIGEWRAENVIPVNHATLWATAPIFLLPLLGVRRVGKGRRVYRRGLLMGLCCVAVTIMLNGEKIPQTAANTFYEYSKGITLFGIAERFEALSACLLTLGWFAMFVYLLGIIYEIAEENQKGYGRWGVWCSLVVVILILYKLPIDQSVTGAFCVISWGILPLLAQGVEWLKKSKKSKKNA